MTSKKDFSADPEDSPTYVLLYMVLPGYTEMYGKSINQNLEYVTTNSFLGFATLSTYVNGFTQLEDGTYVNNLIEPLWTTMGPLLTHKNPYGFLWKHKIKTSTMSEKMKARSLKYES